MKTLLIALSFLSASSAFAGSSVTTLACSSESGRTVISGVLPGQGEMEIRLNVSIGTAMMIYGNGEMDNGATASVDVSPREVSIDVRTQGANFRLVSTGKTNMKRSSNGNKGSFVALMSGTHPGTWEAIPSPIKVRCFLTDEI